MDVDDFARFCKDFDVAVIVLSRDRANVLAKYTDRLAQGGFALRYRIEHETLESIYVADPNGYPVEIAWNTRAIGEADRLDAHFTIEALLDVTDGPTPSIEAFWERKAQLLIDSLERDAEPAR